MSDTTPFDRITATDPMRREINRGLMIAWINADLLERVGHDIDRSVVLYDADRLFVSAAPRNLALSVEGLRELNTAGIRYWSEGIV